MQLIRNTALTDPPIYSPPFVGGPAPPEEKKEDDHPIKKLDTLINHSHKPLFTMSAVFPFDLFPDQLTIEVTQVNIIMKEFFWTERIVTIPIKNISDVLVDTSIFFSTIKIVDVYFSRNEVSLSFLKNNDAKKARRIIQGLVTANKEGIDLAHLSEEEILDKIEEIGKIYSLE